MSSFFRNPNEITDSEDRTDNSTTSDSQSRAQDEDNDPHANFGQTQTLNRTGTIDSTSSDRIAEFSRDTPSVSREESSEWVLRALLEKTCLSEALEEFGRQPGGAHVYTKDHPDVQALAAAKYKFMVKNLGKLNILPSGPERRDKQSQSMQEQFRQGLDYLSSQSPRPGLAPRDNSLLDINSNMRGLVLASSSRNILQNPHHSPRRSIEGIASLPELLQPLIDHAMFERSRYVREFKELRMIGKGGYGKVYHVEHRLDGSNYAVKKINLNGNRVKRIQERGQVELDALLNELRMLAQFDHPNIVRYYGGWLEYSTSMTVRPELRNERLMLEAPPETDEASAGAERLDGDFVEFGTPHTLPDSMDIMFERSGGGILGDLDEMDEQDDLLAELEPQIRTARKRRGSGSTTASAKSKLSSVHSACPEDEDEEAEDAIQLMRVSDTSDPDMSSTGNSHTSDIRPEPESVLTLHIQMSLHPLSLSDFLSTSRIEGEKNNDLGDTRHCFHVDASLQILLAILDGVEYLHECGVVHRDLKPSNIFLKITKSRTPASIDLSKCPDCQKCSHEPRGFLGARIGDFGLVTEIARAEEPQTPIASRAVGTELYRPLNASSKVNEKLDVFALGIIATELLFPFCTRMERHQRLQDVRNGLVDEKLFESSFGLQGLELASVIKGMTCSEEKDRVGCVEVRKRIESLMT